MKRLICAAIYVLAVALVSGCSVFPTAAEPYEYGSGLEGGDVLWLRPGEAQVERGNPHGFLDWIGHNVVSLPSKIILLNWNVANHDISTETEEILKHGEGGRKIV